jgi:hypothetical protein
MITADEFFTAKAQKQQKKKPAAHHHNVYVIELDPTVLKDRKFRAANPGRDPAKPCLYVGATGLSPYERFLNHKDGHKSNRYAEKYGLHLRPDLFDVYNPLPYEAALELEKDLAEGLREEGYAVWQG